MRGAEIISSFLMGEQEHNEVSYQTHNPTIQHGREFSAGIDSKVRHISVLPRVHYNYLYRLH